MNDGDVFVERELLTPIQCIRYDAAIEKTLTEKFAPPYDMIPPQLFGSVNVGERVFYEILNELRPKIEAIVGAKLLNVYSYAIEYVTEGDIKPHTDRSACEWTVTAPVSIKDGYVDFPLSIEGEKDIMLDVSDAVIFRGHDLTHWREPYKGIRQRQALFHYVEADGNYAHLATKKGELTVADNEFIAFNKMMTGQDPDGKYAAYIEEHRQQFQDPDDIKL